jgi:uncharacterized protein YukE
MAATGNETKIDTKLFVATADACAAVAKELDACFQEWSKAVQSLRGNWQGDTSDDFKGIVDSVMKSRSDLLASLGGYKAVLYEMAGIYDKTEKAIQEQSRSLKFDQPLR